MYYQNEGETFVKRDFLNEIIPTARRHWWKIAAVLVCVGGVGWWVLLPSKPPNVVDRSQLDKQVFGAPVSSKPPRAIDRAQLYKQVLGDPASGKPQHFTFYWSASNQKSVDIYQKYVVPLMKKEDPGVETLIVQILDNSVTDENGPGGLMLCPKRIEDYAKLVVGYLNNGTNVGTLKLLPESKGKRVLFMTNETLDEAQRRGLIDPASCMTDEYFWSRYVLALADNKAFFAKSPLKQLPQIQINGTFMLPDDPRVAKFVRSAKTAAVPR